MDFQVAVPPSVPGNTSKNAKVLADVDLDSSPSVYSKFLLCILSDNGCLCQIFSDERWLRTSMH